ncbi:hypothetical protein MLD38_010724 [Melastoma candidum]|uniref:Uncharacterized protein n=1 Tax=Melastoma candidum TaxID=119954 RepID=A0ACB9R943_9MYRT|nr:hypothetical protein MLD38_010724 [Melastoma candidum]
MSSSFCCSTAPIPLSQVGAGNGSKKSTRDVKNLVRSLGVHKLRASPIESLESGNWVKLICGASFEDVVDIRNLSLVYTLAGVDCIDCAADESVVRAVNQGIDAARSILPVGRPWVMISANDDEDLHFRKAEFDPADCPLDCTRPCENVCPANAIILSKKDCLKKEHLQHAAGGVITERCYGCGRCFPVCPYDKIRLVTYSRDVDATAKLLSREDVNALEIHTNGRETSHFKTLWDGLGEAVTSLRLVAVSLPYAGEQTISSMNTMFSIMEPSLRCSNLWQLDGRPMSGDIGRGATRESIAFAVRLAAASDRPSGFLQLAGGTNAHTVAGLRKHGLFQSKLSPRNGQSEYGSFGSSCASIGGIAFGGYARKIVGRALNSMPSSSEKHGETHPLIEDFPHYLWMALMEAAGLVGTVKNYDAALLPGR